MNLNWSKDEENELAGSAFMAGGVEASAARKVALAVATRAVELAAARGGTMTAQYLTETLQDISDAGLPSYAVELGQHIAALGARNTALEADIPRWQENVATVEGERDSECRLRTEAQKERDALRGELEAQAAQAVETLGGQPGEDLQHCAERVRHEWTRTHAELARLRDPLKASITFATTAEANAYCVGVSFGAASARADMGPKPSGQVAEDERDIRHWLGRLADPAPGLAALSRLAAAAQERDTAVRQALCDLMERLGFDGAAMYHDTSVDNAGLANSLFQSIRDEEERTVKGATESLLEEHRKALVRARNAGLEKAAVRCARQGYAGTAAGIRAMKEPES